MSLRNEASKNVGMRLNSNRITTSLGISGGKEKCISYQNCMLIFTTYM